MLKNWTTQDMSTLNMPKLNYKIGDNINILSNFHQTIK
jgi:hypothetical protein